MQNIHLQKGQGASNQPDQNATQAMMLDADSGARHPRGATGKLIAGIAIVWSLFQLWYASPLPFALNFGILNDTQARAIHLAFAVFLAYTAFPAFKSSPRDYVPVQDWLFAVVAAFSASYLYTFYSELVTRPGAPVTLDVVTACAGMVLLLEGTRRALGPPLMIVAGVFLVYVFCRPLYAGSYLSSRCFLIKSRQSPVVNDRRRIWYCAGCFHQFCFSFRIVWCSVGTCRCR